MKKYYGLSKKSKVTLKEYFNIENLESYKNISFDELKFPKGVQEVMIKNNCKTVSDVLNLSFEEIFNFHDIAKNNLRSILYRVESYFFPPKKLDNAMTFEKILNEPTSSENLKILANEIISMSCKNDKEVSVITWRASDETFAKIGEYFGFSREGVRQIEEKVLRKFKNSSFSHVEKIFADLQEVYKKDFITMKDLKNYLGENKAKIILYLAIKAEWDKNFFDFDKKAGAMFFRNKNYKPIDYDKLIQTLPELITADNFQKEISRLIEQTDCDKDFLDLKLSQTYNRTGKFYHRNNLTLFSKIDYVLKEKFADGYKVANKTHYNKFMEYMQELFAYDKKISQKLLDGTINAYIGVLCDRGKYIHPDYVKVPARIIILIKNFIMDSERTAITYKEIFETLKDKFRGTQITNHYFLQGLIKLCKLPYILRKDYLTKDTNVNITREFERFMKQHKIVHDSEIKKYFCGFDYSNISLILQRLPEVIRLGENYFIHASNLNLKEKDFTEIENLLDKLCANGDIHAKYLFKLMQSNYAEFLERNKIDSAGKLFGIVKYMLNDKFDFLRPHIAQKNKLCYTAKNNLLSHLSDTNIISIAKLEDICAKNNISFYTTTNMITELFPEFIRINQFDMCRPESIKLTKKIIGDVSKILKSVIAENEGWLVAATFTDFERLPKLSVEWDSYLLESMINLAGDIKIMKNLSTVPEYSSAVFVDEKIFPEDDFEAFLLKILLAEHKKNPFKSREKMMQWLRKKGLRRTYVPKFLVDGGHLYRDENNILVLK